MKQKNLFLFGSLILITISNAFGAASLRAPKPGNLTAQSNLQQTSSQARAGTLRIPVQKTPDSMISESVETSPMYTDTDTRLASSKGFKNTPITKITSTKTTDQQLNNIDSRIEELQSKLEEAEATQAGIIQEINTYTSDTIYTKEEVNNLLAEIAKQLPTLDDRGNITWTDSNGQTIAVPVGAVVIGGDDAVIVDENLSTTSTNPIQNQAVTNALNEKQDKSTTLSLGDENGTWKSVDSNSYYIELYDKPGADMKQIRIKPSMIVTNLNNMEVKDQLITAGAVKNALEALATNSGGGTQPEYHFNLTNLETRHGGLVQRYTYSTDAPDNEILNFALTFCGGAFSDRWCTLYQNNGDTFTIIKRQEGHNIEDTTNLAPGAMEIMYAVNLPDGVSPQTYTNEHLCTNRTNTCSMDYTWYSGTNGFDFNSSLEPIYFIGIEIHY